LLTLKHFISAIFLQIKPLAARQRSQYLSHASAKSDDGIDLLKHFTDDTRRVCAFFVSCVLLHLNGGPDGGVARRAGVSEAGKVNLVRFHRQ
ncbi:hypothetical protein, partial [Klebsiella pneumoniae]|uniref:hypothetical protein n=1 Tax=Klebsiella pneumoniae TaxID=573 RepID=UPI001C676FE8